MFLNIVGGIIAYFVIRNDDPKKAKRCLIVGASIFAINTAFGLDFIPGLSNPNELFFGDVVQQSQIEIFFEDTEIIISLNDQVQFLAVHEKFILISLDNLVEANNTLPVVSSTDIRMLGTSIPGVIKTVLILLQTTTESFGLQKIETWMK